MPGVFFHGAPLRRWAPQPICARVKAAESPPKEAAMTAEPEFTSFHAAFPPGTGWRQAVSECVDRLDPAARRATLGFVYATDAFAADLDAIVALLRDRLDIDDWVGSVGIGIAAGGREYFDEPALAIMTVALPADSYRLIPNLTRGVEELGATREWAKGGDSLDGPRLGVVHADPRNPLLARLLEDLAQATSGFLVGGLASSRGALDQVAGVAVRGGVSGVLFAPEVAVATGLSQGCSPIGPLRKITAAEANVLFEIDGRPALDVLKEDIGEPSTRRLERVAGLIHAALPVPGSDIGDYLVRNLIGIDPERGWLAIGARVEPGDPILFVRRDRAAAEKDLARMLAGLKRRTTAAPKAGLYFSCVARGPNLFGPDSAELGILARELGEFPLVGMFCNGEISHNRLYGYTGVLALFL
ncbi:MAG: FIST signal transduction protein [Pseudomonadota bacterium]